MDTHTRLLLAILANFKITMLLVHEKWGTPIRDRAGVWIEGADGRPITFLGRVLNCFWCTSALVAIPLAIWTFGPSTHALVGGCAIAGGTVLVYQWSGMYRLFRER